MPEERPAPEEKVLGLEELAAAAALWKKSGRELWARFGGSSMEPTVPPGSELLLRCGDQGAIGDVVAFLSGGQMIVHRIVARSGARGWVLTRGDARVLPDPPIRDPESILGRVVGIRQGARFTELPSPYPSLFRRATLSPLLLALHASPAAGGAMIRLLLSARRRAASLWCRLRKRGGGA
jgi:hypothetical protein